MKMEVLQFGEATPAQLEKFRMMPTFRKATRAMSLACASIEDACTSLDKTAEILKKSPKRFALVCGSAFGELETTKDFLKRFADTGVASPLLFQNSLHNSTSGFASIHFHFTGAVITVSHGLFAFENGLETASLLLSQQQADFAVVTYVETSVAGLANPTSNPAQVSSDPKSQPPVDMSMSILLTTNEVLKREGLQSLGTLVDISCHRQLGAALPSYSDICHANPTPIETFRNEFSQPKARASQNSSAPSYREFSITHANRAISKFKWSHD